MAKGRKQTPNALKTLRGTDQPCRMTPAVELDKVIVLPKSGLKGAAKRVFELVSAELIHKGILESVGLDLLVAYAREMALYHELMREMEATGTVTPGNVVDYDFVKADILRIAAGYNLKSTAYDRWNA